MTDEQFKDFIDKFDKVFDERFQSFEERLEPRFQKIESQLDWIVDALDTDERERLALGHNFDRKIADHESRIKNLELASR